MNNYSNFNRYSKVGKNSFALVHKDKSGSYLMFSKLVDKCVLTYVEDRQTQCQLAFPKNVTVKVAMDVLNSTVSQLNVVKKLFA